MKREEILKTVQSIFSKELQVDISDDEMEVSLATLNIDSLDILKLAIALEKTFDIEISTSEIANINTFKDIVSGLESKLKKAT
jgi:acyl carrier protein